MRLPKFLERYWLVFDTQSDEEFRKLWRVEISPALSIAWDMLKKVQLESPYKGVTYREIEEALRRIEELDHG